MTRKQAEARVVKDRLLLKKLQAEASRAREFPTNTCPASRHLHIMADCLAKGKMYPMLTEEPQHCAMSILSVLASLWEARTALARKEKK